MEQKDKQDPESRGFENEFTFITARSGGPGGQHVNKTESKVELRFDIDKSAILRENEKRLLKTRLSNRISSEGVLKVTSQISRSQHKNKEDTITKFYELINEALLPEKERKPTKPPRSSKEKRLKDKRIDSLKKDRRRKPGEEE